MQKSRGTGAAAPLEGIQLRRSEVHGRGVFALRDWRAGEEIGLNSGRRDAPDATHPA